MIFRVIFGRGGHCEEFNMVIASEGERGAGLRRFVARGLI